jgi:hypothetical protein
MRVTDDLKGARISVVGAAELANMHPAHFRRLIRRGVFPKPKRTAKGRPYFDYDLLTGIAGILKGGVGQNGEEIVFYRRQPKNRTTRGGPRRPAPAAAMDGYLAGLAEGLRQVGIPEELLTPAKLQAAMTAAFGQERPDLAVVIPDIAQRLMQ